MDSKGSTETGIVSALHHGRQSGTERTGSTTIRTALQRYFLRPLCVGKMDGFQRCGLSDVLQRTTCGCNTPECEQFYISCDYGTVNPSSFGLWGYCKTDQVWYRLQEYYYDARKEGCSRTDEAHYTALEALAGNRTIEAVIIDPSAASMIACIAQHGRFRVIRADNDVLAGIQRVSTALQQERIRFSAACTDTLREFGMYCWEDARHGDAPKKEFDHAMDDVRYFVSTVLRRKAEDDFFTAAIGRR